MKNIVQKLSLATTGAALTVMSAASTVLASNTGITPIRPSPGYAYDFGKLINNVLSIVMVIALLLVLLYLVLGGIEWITSGGDKGKTESARNKITAAVIGIIILAASYALVSLVALVLGFTSFSDAVTGIPKLNQ